jgi:hypothetical protein
MNKFLYLLPAAALLAACSSTTLSGSWKDPDYRGQIRKVYIVGVAKQEITRRIFEDSFGRELSALGVTGIASYRDLPADELDRKEAIVAQLQRNGADAILMARMIGIRTEQVTNPGYVSGSYFAPAPYYREWDSFYERRFDAVYQPATVSEYQVAAIEANLYDVKTGKLIWSAQLETVVDSDMDKLFGDFVKIVIRDLQNQGLL